MSTMRARSLPRVREALEKAERARFYKQRTNKYTDEVRLVKALGELENERVSSLASIKQQIMDLRMQALHIRDEEKALLEADFTRLQDLMHKVEVNKQRNFLQDAKYKPKRAREQFVERYERWKAEDAAEADWRPELPQREPQVRLDEHLIYPAKRERKNHRRLYREITRRPDSRVGEKALRRLRDLHTEGRTYADAAFFEELESELNSAREATAAAATSEASPFVTQQLSLVQTIREKALQRILDQIEATRRAIRYWEVPAGEGTKERLGECCQTRRHVVRRPRLKPLPEAAGEEEEENDDDGLYDAAGNGGDGGGGGGDGGGGSGGGRGKVRFRRGGSQRRMASDAARRASEAADADGGEGEGDGSGEGEGEERGARRLSKRMSRDFNRRRMSLMRELDEEEVSPEERARRMREFELAWAEVLKCKYIRGYEPPEMRLPEGQTATDFVFGEAQARGFEKLAAEAAAAAAATAVAAQN